MKEHDRKRQRRREGAHSHPYSCSASYQGLKDAHHDRLVQLVAARYKGIADPKKSATLDVKGVWRHLHFRFADIDQLSSFIDDVRCVGWPMVVQVPSLLHPEEKIALPEFVPNPTLPPIARRKSPAPRRA